MDILDDMGVSQLSAKVFSKVNYSFNITKQGKLAPMGMESSACDLLLIKQHRHSGSFP